MQTLLTDCHCHISGRHIRNNGEGLRQMLDRCCQTGVGDIYISLFDTELDWIETIESVADSHNVNVHLTLGIEPPSLSRGLERLDSRIEIIIAVARQFAEAHRITAIGETGLDYYWPVVNFLELKGCGDEEIRENLSSRKADILEEAAVKKTLRIQRLVFSRMIELAKELNLPLVIHEREAFGDTLELLGKCKVRPERTMFHCFGHGLKEAEYVLENGYWISLPSSLGLREPFHSVAQIVPLDRLLLETDSPYHSPMANLWKIAKNEAQKDAGPGSNSGRMKSLQREKFRSLVEIHLPELKVDMPDGRTVPAADYFMESFDNIRKNEPAFIRSSAVSLAELRNITFEKICKQTSGNVSTFFCT